MGHASVYAQTTHDGRLSRCDAIMACLSASRRTWRLWHELAGPATPLPSAWVPDRYQSGSAASAVQRGGVVRVASARPAHRRPYSSYREADRRTCRPRFLTYEGEGGGTNTLRMAGRIASIRGPSYVLSTSSRCVRAASGRPISYRR
jgi:hypothetical protein